MAFTKFILTVFQEMQPLSIIEWKYSYTCTEFHTNTWVSRKIPMKFRKTTNSPILSLSKSPTNSLWYTVGLKNIAASNSVRREGSPQNLCGAVIGCFKPTSGAVRSGFDTTCYSRDIELESFKRHLDSLNEVKAYELLIQANHHEEFKASLECILHKE